MKQCYLVVGPESSGNRLLASVLIRAGCIGDASTDQRWDQTLPETETPAVVIRSFPHGDIWPDLNGIVATLKERGYIVTILVTVRNPAAVISSQIRREHAVNESSAEYSIQKAYREIMSQTLAPFYFVPYESIVHGKEPAIKSILKLIGLPEITDGPVIVDGMEMPIRNRNRKHYRK